MRRRGIHGNIIDKVVFHGSLGDYITDLNSASEQFGGTLIELSSRRTVGCQMQLPFISGPRLRDEFHFVEIYEMPLIQILFENFDTAFILKGFLIMKSQLRKMCREKL